MTPSTSLEMKLGARGAPVPTRAQDRLLQRGQRVPGLLLVHPVHDQAGVGHAARGLRDQRRLPAQCRQQVLERVDTGLLLQALAQRAERAGQSLRAGARSSQCLAEPRPEIPDPDVAERVGTGLVGEPRLELRQVGENRRALPLEARVQVADHVHLHAVVVGARRDGQAGGRAIVDEGVELGRGARSPGEEALDARLGEIELGEADVGQRGAGRVLRSSPRAWARVPPSRRVRLGPRARSRIAPGRRPGRWRARPRRP